jgi:predicted DNA-binding WGR domain protein
VPRYELVSKTSNKFWEIALAGSAFETRYGRRGTPGRVAKKKFASAAQAQASYDRIIAEKVREGYALVSPAGARRQGNAPAAAEAVRAWRIAGRRRQQATAAARRDRRRSARGARARGPIHAPHDRRARRAQRQRERFEKKIKNWRKVIDAMRVWEKQNPLPADMWHTGQPGARDPYRQLTHVPVPVATFLQRVKWSRQLRHEGLEEMVDLDMGNSGEGIDVEIKDKRRVLCPFGRDDSHEYFLDALDGSADPMVYTTDGDGLGEYDMCKLSIFLSHVSLKGR